LVRGRGRGRFLASPCRRGGLSPVPLANCGEVSRRGGSPRGGKSRIKLIKQKSHGIPLSFPKKRNHRAVLCSGGIMHVMGRPPGRKKHLPLPVHQILLRDEGLECQTCISTREISASRSSRRKKIEYISGKDKQKRDEKKRSTICTGVRMSFSSPSVLFLKEI